jgi:hypothetical protein
MGWTLMQNSSTECGVSECDREAKTISRPCPTMGCHAMGEKMQMCNLFCLDPENIFKVSFVLIKTADEC